MTIQERAEIAEALKLPRVMTAEEVAEFSGAHRNSIYKAIDEGKLKAIRIAGCLRILSIDLITYKEGKGKK